ncbi:MAG TPA: phosphate acyltransferase PlsX [Nitrospirae bacterium]|nr:phosphate acyltransferase [bacterium BMS3Abin10]GBE38673.1 phosphate acyltransferase [bacterium BMS3Bbin08]HDH00486.1 phosphate acyltransferase PlsX [Nitrospirota bacterium]HDH51491.1 phosphate acyltransferase PlsX [Nitrospirota bacterium]HDK41638.1 phosphate acyltransferase PlsX [Nitrospirota bacterium]
MRIALDAMGGDFAPAVTVEGAVEAVNETRGLSVTLVGNENEIADELHGKKFETSVISVKHASQVVGMHEAPLTAIRRKKDSSIKVALDLVRAGEADAMVSAGNSAVVMAKALLTLGKLTGVDRPAIAAVMPTLKGLFVLIDAGANVDCKAANLYQFAIMGEAYAKSIFDIEIPRVGLLGIGEEDAKGNELTKETFKLLKDSGLEFIGNIEGKNIFMGDADVVVCDGFVGNIALKISEGLAEVIAKMLKREISESTSGRIGYFLMKDALRSFRKRTDYSEYGGAPLLGLSKPCIISHGRSTAKAIKNAVKIAGEFYRKGVLDIISKAFTATGPKKGKR